MIAALILISILWLILGCTIISNTKDEALDSIPPEKRSIYIFVVAGPILFLILFFADAYNQYFFPVKDDEDDEDESSLA